MVITTKLTTGAFGAHPGHDAHIHATLSALQVLIMQDALERCDVERVVKCELRFHCPPPSSVTVQCFSPLT